MKKETTKKAVVAKKATTPKTKEVKKSAAKATAKTVVKATVKTMTAKAEAKTATVKKTAAPASKAKEVKKNSLEARVRAVAVSGKMVGMGDWVKNRKNKEKRDMHLNVCKKLVEYSDKNGGYPITYLVYFAVGKNAHRLPTFVAGYEKFDENKAKTIFSWLRAFAKAVGNPKAEKNANVMHAICAYYDRVSKSHKKFKEALAAYKEDAKAMDFKTVAKGLGLATKEEADMALATAK